MRCAFSFFGEAFLGLVWSRVGVKGRIFNVVLNWHCATPHISSLNQYDIGKTLIYF